MDEGESDGDKEMNATLSITRCDLWVAEHQVTSLGVDNSRSTWGILIITNHLRLILITSQRNTYSAEIVQQ